MGEEVGVGGDWGDDEVSHTNTTTNNNTTTNTTIGIRSRRHLAVTQLAVHLMRGMIDRVFTVNDDDDGPTNNSVAARRGGIFCGSVLDSFYSSHVSPIEVYRSSDGMLWVVATVLQALLTVRPQPTFNALSQPALSDISSPPFVTGLFDSATTTELITHLFGALQQVHPYTIQHPYTQFYTHPFFSSYQHPSNAKTPSDPSCKPTQFNLSPPL